MKVLGCLGKRPVMALRLFSTTVIPKEEMAGHQQKQKERKEDLYNLR